MKIKLLPVPNTEWGKKYSELLNNSFIKYKYNRERRLKSKEEYIDKYLPEIKTKKGIILDLGPGPGEFLEICRYYGNEIVGIDAKEDDSIGMGTEYIKLSKLLTERQKINVLYNGVENYIKNKNFPFKDQEISVINSQGSIEQIFRENFKLSPHANHDGKQFEEWIFDEKLKNNMNNFISECKRIIKPSGVLLIYANGAKSLENTKKYRELLLKTIKETGGFELVFEKDFRLHKFRKTEC
jgi:SAM-dependent methyltransferase